MSTTSLPPVVIPFSDEVFSTSTRLEVQLYVYSSYVRFYFFLIFPLLISSLVFHFTLTVFPCFMFSFFLLYCSYLFTRTTFLCVGNTFFFLCILFFYYQFVWFIFILVYLWKPYCCFQNLYYFFLCTGIILNRS